MYITNTSISYICCEYLFCRYRETGAYYGAVTKRVRPFYTNLDEILGEMEKDGTANRKRRGKRSNNVTSLPVRLSTTAQPVQVLAATIRRL